MTPHRRIHHHPDPEMLAEYAAGRLHRGAMLVIACHLESCALCAREISVWESAGGALLEDAAPVAMAKGALALAMTRLDAAASPRAAATPDFLSRFDVPRALAAQNIGRRRFVTPSIWFAPVGDNEGEARTYLVHAGPGTILSEHQHRGREFTHVMAGAFSDASGTFRAGDFALTDETLMHAPTVTADGACLCLISTDAPMHLMSLPARILQAVTGRHY
jgi:putative transcriptional regulator